MRQYTLSKHALARVLERTPRAPVWLMEALRQNQFVQLQFGAQERRMYALIFDALEQAYLVAVLSKRDPKVVTLLTQDQYENVHGVIPPVMLQLAQSARMPSIEAAPAESSETKTPWNSRWKIWLSLVGYHGRHKFSVLLDIGWRQVQLRKLCMLAVHESPSEVLQQDFTQQAKLITTSEAFQGWLIETLRGRGEKISQLTSVWISSNHSLNARLDMTHEVRRVLERDVSADSIQLQAVAHCRQ